MATSTIFATNTTSATLNTVTAVTKVKLVASSADCSSASSNELTVIPQDTVEPVLICPAGPLLAYVNINCKTAVPDVLALVSATDACGPVSIVQSPASGTTITASTTVTITAKDQSNNSTTCAVLISVTDTIAPQFTLCPNDIIISTTGPTALVSYPTPSALDNCSSVTINRISGPASGASFPMGSTNVTWRASDDSGNTALCDFIVTVVPNTAPVINCPNDIVAYTAPGTCTAEVAYPVPVGTDDSGGTTAQTDHTGHVSGSMYPIGSYVQEYTMSANDGGFATCSFHIEVIDTVPPVISCPASISTNSASNQCSSLVTYGDPSLSDNCMGCAPTNIPQHALVGTFQGHTYYRSWTADEWNVANTAALSVPNGHLVTIGSPSEQAWLVNALYAQLGGNLPFWMGLTDATTEGTWTWVTGEPLDWSNWNTGNGQPDNVGNADHAYLNDPGTSFWDDAPSTTLLPWIIEAECLPALEVTRTSGPASGSTFPVGITPVVFQAIDHGGNISSCTFNVAVNDVTPPALSCPSNIELDAPVGTCDTVVDFTAVAMDNCSGPVTLSYTQPPGTTFPVGQTTVSVTATDGSNTSPACTFTVRVNDIQAPSIQGLPTTLPSDYNTASCNTTVPDLSTLLTTSEICSMPVSVNQSPGGRLVAYLIRLGDGLCYGCQWECQAGFHVRDIERSRGPGHMSERSGP